METISNSDNGYEKTYQGTVAVVIVKCLIKPGTVKKFSYKTVAS
ncbi:MAG: hypothetical protein LBT07_02815 [Endomicrobium sp.]|nr:hypothetical protein [Endomicrobium sp.]